MLFNKCGRLSTKNENTTKNAVVKRCAIFATTTQDETPLNGTYNNVTG